MKIKRRRAGIAPWAAVGILSMLLAAGFGRAEAFYCGSRIVHRGDTAYDVKIKCGVPTHRIVRYGPLPERLPDGTGLAIAPRIEEWTYDFGPRRLTRRLTFRDGILVQTTQGDYGFPFPPSPVTACSDGRLFQRGDTQYETLRTCGEPSDRSVRRVRLRAAVPGDESVVRWEVIDRWIYDFGPNRLLQVLEFRDGRLDRIDTRGYGN